MWRHHETYKLKMRERDEILEVINKERQQRNRRIMEKNQKLESNFKAKQTLVRVQSQAYSLMGSQMN